MSKFVRIALAGAGLIGRRHAAAVRTCEAATLTCIIDPDPDAANFAAEHGVPCFRSLHDAIAAGGIDAVILASPNRAHVDGALSCIAAGLPVLVEKPLADTVEGATAIAEAGEKAGVAVAVGHHRRHNPLVATAKEQIAQGALGRIVAVQGFAWLMKPDDYFNVDWRRRKGAGPVYLNLIPDIDLLQHLCGPIAGVQALESNAVRGAEVEDTAALLLHFASGALGTVTVSDTIPAPWSWELTARENPAYPATAQSCYTIGGTLASLSLPDLTLWQTSGARSWWSPVSATKLICNFADPLVRQVKQFCRVATGVEPPLVSARDGLAALKVIEAAKNAAATGSAIAVDP